MNMAEQAVHRSSTLLLGSAYITCGAPTSMAAPCSEISMASGGVSRPDHDAARVPLAADTGRRGKGGDAVGGESAWLEEPDTAQVPLSGGPGAHGPAPAHAHVRAEHPGNAGIPGTIYSWQEQACSKHGNPLIWASSTQ